MSDHTPLDNLAKIREILNREFDDSELEALCLDHFRPVFDRFGSGMRKDEKITLLLDFCQRAPKRLELLLQLIGGSQTEIPIVIVAMTRQQADELINETVFNNSSFALAEQESFREFKSFLTDDQIKSLVFHYENEREQWKPYLANDVMISEIVEAMVKDINQNKQGFDPNIMHSRFYSNQFFASERQTRLQIWDELSWRGCILIIDALSLFHPEVYRRLLQSEMGADQRVVIGAILLSPVILANASAKGLIKQIIQERMQRAFYRFESYSDFRASLAIESQHHFEEWCFKTALPEVWKIVHEQKEKKRPTVINLSRIRRKIKESRVENVIFGEGVPS